MAGLSLLVVGDLDRAEFREARVSLKPFGFTAAADIAEAETLLAGGAIADAILIAQAYPNQFSTEAVDRLRQRAPLARIVGLLGSLCEGEGRTGRPWPGAIRIYWHQWTPRELQRLIAGETSTWALPATASEDERQLLVADRPLPERAWNIAIRSRNWEMQEMLRRVGTAHHELPSNADLVGNAHPTGTTRLRRVGTAHHESSSNAEMVGNAHPTDAGVFDLDECDPGELVQLRAFANQLAPAPVLALIGFPRAEDRDALLAAGAAAVLSKPFLIEDLLEKLDAIIRRSE